MRSASNLPHPTTRASVGVGLVGHTLTAVALRPTRPSRPSRASRPTRARTTLTDAIVLHRPHPTPASGPNPPAHPSDPTAAAHRTPADPTPADPTADDLARLAAALHRRGLDTAEIHFAAPRALLMAGVVEAPPRRSEAPREQIARAQMARMFHVEPGAFELALWDLPETPNRDAAAQLLACGCAHEVGGRLADAFGRAGLSLASLVPGELAAAALLTDGDDPGLVAVVEVGEWSAHITLVAGGRFLYERTVEGAGGGGIALALGESLGMRGEAAERVARGLSGAGGGMEGAALAAVVRAAHPLGEAVACEVAGAFDFAQHRWPEMSPSGVRLTGAYGRAPGLAELVTLRAGVEAVVADAGACVEVSGSARARVDEGLLASALAAALGVLRDTSGGRRGLEAAA